MKNPLIKNENAELPQQVICHFVCTKEDVDAMLRIKDFFEENAETAIDRIAFDVLSRVLKPFIDKEN